MINSLLYILDDIQKHQQQQNKKLRPTFVFLLVLLSSCCHCWERHENGDRNKKKKKNNKRREERNNNIDNLNPLTTQSRVHSLNRERERRAYKISRFLFHFVPYMYIALGFFFKRACFVLSEEGIHNTSIVMLILAYSHCARSPSLFMFRELKRPLKKFNVFVLVDVDGTSEHLANVNTFFNIHSHINLSFWCMLMLILLNDPTIVGLLACLLVCLNKRRFVRPCQYKCSIIYLKSHRID